jgi:restriction system protein|tara:strand:+ start:76 stop:1128 length:1053 start_codon:yes stop_codon:yes gene_type:complete
MNAWLVRAGRNGERESHNLEIGVVGGGFVEVGDLSGASGRTDVLELVKAAWPTDLDKKHINFAGQLWALRGRMEVGDLVVLPLKTTKQIAIGRVTGEYRYDSDVETDKSHIRPVEWLRTDIPRPAVLQDLLHSMGAFMTVCRLSRNDAAWRIEQLAETGTDPGARPSNGAPDSQPSGAEDESDEDLVGFDVEQYAIDRVTTVISERFAGHGLAHLVGAVLEAEGFVCDVATPGPDGGIDVFAGSGPLGLDAPRLLVQVKSGANPVGPDTVRQLHGVIATHGADQGLLVTWGGVNKTARRELENQRFNLRVWDSSDLIEAVCRNYHRLSKDLQSALPLKQVWAVVETDSDS